MRIQTLLAFFTLCSMTACLKQPVLHKENNYPFAKENQERICTTIKESFPDYSCPPNLNQPFKVNEQSETVEIVLSKNKLKLIYHTKEDNANLFEQYKQLTNHLEK